LFDAFIPAAYPALRTGPLDTAERAERWLVFLAHHLKHTIGTPDLAWWQLEKPHHVLPSGSCPGASGAA